MPSPGRNSGGIGRVSAKLVSWLTIISPLPTRTLWECVPCGMPIAASSFGFFGSRTSITEVPWGLRMCAT